MKKRIVISICVAGLSLSMAAQKRAGGGSKASFDQFVKESNKAQTDNDAKWMEANLSDSYVEGTSFGTWVTKAELIKDAGDPANNKFTKADVSDMKSEVIGNVGMARFKESYDAVIQGRHRARTIICSMTAVKEAAGWKGLSTHCSKIE